MGYAMQKGIDRGATDYLQGTAGWQHSRQTPLWKKITMGICEEVQLTAWSSATPQRTTRLLHLNHQHIAPYDLRLGLAFSGPALLHCMSM